MLKERIEVVAYSGYRGEETPRAFKRRGGKVEVAGILSRWIEEEGADRTTKRGFRLMGTDGIEYRVFYDEQIQEWFCEAEKDDL